MMASDRERQAGLGEFFRVQRERLTPEQVGLPTTRRRRTPGLRREEVALLTGISATWYTRLEQGRDVAASPKVLAELAKVFQLNHAARHYLYELAGHALAPRSAAEPGGPTRELAASVASISAPAYILDGTWTACVWNDAARDLFNDWLGGDDRNLLRYVFLHPSARTFIVDWETRARRLVAEFRADCVDYVHAPIVADLLMTLRRGCEQFGQWWDEQFVLEREGGERFFRMPDGSILRRNQLTLVRSFDPGYKLVMLLE